MKKKWSQNTFPIERSPMQRLFWLIGYGIAILTVGFLALHLSRNVLVEVPLRGGSFTEGLVGSPRFINPLLATSDTDRDLTALIYSGLLKATASGELVPDLAQSFDMSDDGLTYTFTIREDAKFHDGTPVTSADVLFTVSHAQNQLIKSPKRANWEQVAVEQLDERRVRFTLPKPYAPFLENATLGILPKHLWENVAPNEFPFSSLNTEPIGTGPYTVEIVKHNASGIPLSYTLKAFTDATLGEPYVQNIIFRFYPNEEELIAAFNRHEIESVNSISPSRVPELAIESVRARIERTPLPRVFGVFFNQNQAPILAERAVREALNTAIDRSALITSVLDSYGTPIDGPLPPQTNAPHDREHITIEERVATAAQILSEAGWVRNEETGFMEKEVDGDVRELAFTIATADVAELAAAAKFVKQQWETVGAHVTVQIFEVHDLTQNIIRPRKYDALLFGEVVGRDMDLFAFWHSSQRSDPGLNIALYANIAADSLLEEARTTDLPERLQKYQEFAEEVQTDIPAVFLYVPDYVYVVPDRLKGFQFSKIAESEERFLAVDDWYVETEYVWPIFIKKGTEQ